MRETWEKVKLQGGQVSDKLGMMSEGFKMQLTEDVEVFIVDAKEFRADFVANGPMVEGVPPMEAAERMRKFKRLYEERQRKWDSYCEGEELFGLQSLNTRSLRRAKASLSFWTSCTHYMSTLSRPSRTTAPTCGLTLWPI